MVLQLRASWVVHHQVPTSGSSRNPCCRDTRVASLFEPHGVALPPLKKSRRLPCSLDPDYEPSGDFVLEDSTLAGVDSAGGAAAEATAHVMEGGRSPRASPVAFSIFEEDELEGPFLMPPPSNPTEGAPCTAWGIAEKNISSVYHPEVLEHVSEHLFTPRAVETCRFEGAEGTFNRLKSYHLQGLNAMHFLKLEMEAMHEQLQELGAKAARDVMEKELSDAWAEVEGLMEKVGQLETDLGGVLYPTWQSREEILQDKGVEEGCGFLRLPTRTGSRWSSRLNCAGCLPHAASGF